MFYDAVIHSIQDFVRYKAEEFIEIYEIQTQKKADFGVNEIEISLEMAKAVENVAKI